MPVLKHAKKKLKQDKKRTIQNLRLKNLYKSLAKKARQNPTAEAVSQAFAQIDKAAKNHIIHPNKAARLKSSLSKVVGGTAPARSETAKTKKATKAKIISNKTAAKAAKAPKAKANTRPATKK